MLHPLVLIVVVGLVGYDAIGPLFDSPFPATVSALIVISASALIALGTHLRLVRLGRRLDRTGDFVVLRAADRTLALSRVLTTAVFLVALFGLGWLDAVRRAIGDWVGVDEILAAAPPLLVFAAGWWSYEPIDRRLHEAMLVRAMDTGLPIHPPPSRGQYTLDKLRSTALGALAPLVLILLWGEAARFAFERWGWLPWPADDERTLLAIAGAQVVGAGVVLAFSPPLVLAIWRTTTLPAGELRDRLVALCKRHRVRVGGFRVWRTRGLVLNGAVLGVLPRLRYVLLTDALIERLDGRELDAVMAHEIAHVRRRHLPWLIAALAGALGGASFAIGWIADEAAGAWALNGGAWRGVIEGAGLTLALVIGLVVFGLVSRLFERQADAFAVRAAAEEEGAGVVTPDAAEAMAGALERVARINHIPMEKFTWRHGSIADRCRRVRRLIGARVDRLPVDAAVRRAKAVIALTLLALVALVMFLPATGAGSDDTPRDRAARPFIERDAR